MKQSKIGQQFPLSFSTLIILLFPLDLHITFNQPAEPLASNPTTGKHLHLQNPKPPKRNPPPNPPCQPITETTNKITLNTKLPQPRTQIPNPDKTLHGRQQIVVYFIGMGYSAGGSVAMGCAGGLAGRWRSACCWRGLGFGDSGRGGVGGAWGFGGCCCGLAGGSSRLGVGLVRGSVSVGWICGIGVDSGLASTANLYPLIFLQLNSLISTEMQDSSQALPEYIRAYVQRLYGYPAFISRDLTWRNLPYLQVGLLETNFTIFQLFFISNNLVIIFFLLLTTFLTVQQFRQGPPDNAKPPIHKDPPRDAEHKSS